MGVGTLLHKSSSIMFALGAERIYLREHSLIGGVDLGRLEDGRSKDNWDKVCRPGLRTGLICLGDKDALHI